MTYGENMREFIVRTHAGQKLSFSKCDGLYICDMATQVYRNHRARLDDGVELFFGTYKKTDNWALKTRLDLVNSHHRTLVAAATAYPEMQQRDQYQEAINWLHSDADALEAAIEFRRKERFDTTYGMSHLDNTIIPKRNPHEDHEKRLDDIYSTRFQLDQDRFFSGSDERNLWETKKMAEAKKLLKAPPLNKTRDWIPPPNFKAVLTLLRSSAAAGVSTKAGPTWNELQK
jgi:hypothetical protein